MGIRRSGMPLIGIVAKNKDIQTIRKEFIEKNVEIIEITRESIKNIKNIKFDEIIFLKNLDLEDEEYKYLNEVISKVPYLILNGDIEIDILKKIDLKKPVKLITLGFNSKSTITISSISDEKIIVYLQRDIEKTNGELLERQEKEIICKFTSKIYNNLAVFIIKELHNL